MTSLTPADYPGCPVAVTAAVAQGRALRPLRWGLWDVVWAGLATLALGAATAALLAYADPPAGGLATLAVLAVPWLGMGGWPILATIRRGNGPVLDFGLTVTWRDVGWAVVAAWIAVVGALVGFAITHVFVPDVTSSAAELAAGLADATGENRLVLVAFALFVMVGGPVVEELFFRGLLFGALRKRGVSALWTVVVTALVFTGFHFEPMRVLILLPTALALGWVRHRTGSTGASMLAHGLVNAPGALALLVGVPQMSP